VKFRPLTLLTLTLVTGAAACGPAHVQNYTPKKR
jgi:hypothetical protein